MADLDAALEARHPRRLPKHNTMLAVAGVIIEDGKLLLVRDTHGFWAGVGGWIEPGESPEDALIREFREELGVDTEVARVLRPFIAWNIPRSEDPLHFILFLFRMRLLTRDFTPDPTEVTGHTWASPEEIADLDMLPHARATFEDRLKEWLAD